MTRGIVPVVALLVIASAFSQFSGPSGLVLSSANPPANSSPAPSSPVGGAGTSSNSEKVDCKDLRPCIPRADLGPWVASCEFALAQLVPEKSPEAAIGTGKPVNDQLKGVAANVGVENPLDPRNKPRQSAASDRWCLSRLQQPGELQSVIVTLPDPIHSHLALDFDRRIDAIQTAALQEGYVLDHFWLPWRGIRIAPSENPDLKTNDRVLQQLRLDEPGLEKPLP